MSNTIKDVNGKDFAAFIKEGKVVVDFWAAWCGPCRTQGQILEDGEKSFEDAGVKVAKVNVEQENALAAQYGVSSIPALLIFEDGELKETLVGVQTVDSLIARFN